MKTRRTLNPTTNSIYTNDSADAAAADDAAADADDDDDTTIQSRRIQLLNEIFPTKTSPLTRTNTLTPSLSSSQKAFTVTDIVTDTMKSPDTLSNMLNSNTTSNTLTPNTLTPKTLTPKTLTPNTLTPKTLTSNTLTSKTLTSNTLTPKTLTPKTLTPNRTPNISPNTLSPNTLSPNITPNKGQVIIDAEDFDDEWIGTQAYVLKLKREALEFNHNTITNNSNNKENSIEMKRQFWEEVLQKIERTEQEVEEQMKHVEIEVNETERKYQKDMHKMTEEQEKVHNTWKKIEKRMSKVSHDAVHIGTALHTAEMHKKNTEKAIDVMQTFMSFQRGDIDTCAPMFTMTSRTPEMLKEAAEMIQLMNMVVESVTIAGTEKACAQIEQASNSIENEMLERFAVAANRGALGEMRNYADTLVNFKGKAIIQRYVFMVLESFSAEFVEAIQQMPAISEAKEEMENDIMEELPSVVDFNRQLMYFCGLAEECVRSQMKVIAAVFTSQTTLVMKTLLSRLFSERLQGFIDSKLTKSEITVEEYLRMLCIAYTQTGKLIDSIQNVPKSLLSTQLFEENLSDYRESLFVKYRENYLAKEQELLDIVAAEQIKLVHVTNSADEDVKKSETDMFGRKSKMAILNNKQRFVVQVLESEIVNCLIDKSVECVLRIDKMAGNAAIAYYNSDLYLHMFRIVVDKFLHSILNDSESFYPSLDPKEPPDPFLLHIVKRCNDTVASTRFFFNRYSLPRMQDDANIIAICQARVRDLSASVERKITVLLEKVMESNVKWVEKLASRQKNSDFKPKDDSVLDDLQPTAVCQAICAFIAQHCEACTVFLTGQNLDNYVRNFCLRACNIIVTELQKQSVNALGASVLVRDIKEYCDTLEHVMLPALQARISELRALAGLFFVPPETLTHVFTSTIEGATLSRMDPDELVSWLRMRHDWSAVREHLNGFKQNA